MLSSNNQLRKYFLCFLLNMSSGETRSRSPPRDKGNTDSNAAASTLPRVGDDAKIDGFTEIWDTICPKMDNKLSDFASGFKEDVKTVVSSMVKNHVERLEKKIESNQQLTNTNIKNLEKQMDDKFSHMEGNLLKAIQASKDAPAPPAPSGAPEGGATGGPSFSVADGRNRFEPRPGAAISTCPPWINQVTTSHFNRVPDATKLFCNIHDRVQVAKTKFREKMLVLVFEAGLKESDFTLLGDALDFRFEMVFSGDLHLASVKAQQFHSSLNLGRGKYKPQFVECAESKEHKFYVNPDKNPAQVRKEVLAKRLQSFFSPMRVDKTFYVKKSSGSVYCDNRCVATIVLTGEESARIDWCHPKRLDLKILQEDVESAFSHFVVAGGPSS